MKIAIRAENVAGNENKEMQELDKRTQ